MKQSDALWRRVLIVDDDRDTREMYCEALRSKGFDPWSAATAEEGLGVAADLAPAVLVTDLRLQGRIDGIELVRRLRRDERTRNVRIIMLTGATFGDERERAEAAGCDRFLTKPCLPDDLAAEIRRLAVATFSPRKHGGNLPAGSVGDRSKWPHPSRRKV